MGMGMGSLRLIDSEGEEEDTSLGSTRSSSFLACTVGLLLVRGTSRDNFGGEGTDNTGGGGGARVCVTVSCRSKLSA